MKQKSIIGAVCGIAMFFVCSALAASADENKLIGFDVTSIEYNVSLPAISSKNYQ